MTDRFVNLISGFKTSNLNLNINFTNVTNLLPKNLVPVALGSQPEEPVKRTPEQLEEEIKNVKQQIKQEQKALEDIGVLINLYEKSKDQQGLEQAQKAMQDMEQKIEDLKRKKEQLKDERPPRPLPQLEFVTVSTTSSNPKEGATIMLSAPPKLDLTEVKQFLANQATQSQKKASMRANNTTTAAEPAKPKIRYAILLWDFQAREEGEITVRAKELVSVVQTYGFEESDTDWWKICNAMGKEGFVPSSYLEPVGESGKKTATLTMPKVQLPFEALALYDYVATNQGELSFYYGDILKVTKMDYPGWWTGELEDGTTGVIPSNYVQKLTEQMKQKLMEQRAAMQKLAEAKLREQELAAQQAQQEAQGTSSRPSSQAEGTSTATPPSTTPTPAPTKAPETTSEPAHPAPSEKQAAEEPTKITKPLPTPEKSNTASSTRTAAILSPSKPATATTSTTSASKSATVSTPAPKTEPPRPIQKLLTEAEQQDFPPFGEAILDYTAVRSDELSFQMGEILRIVSHPIKGWYKAYILKGPSKLPKASFKHLMGLIPSNLIVEIPEKEAMEKAVALEAKKQLPRQIVRKSTVNHPLLDD